MRGMERVNIGEASQAEAEGKGGKRERQSANERRAAQAKDRARGMRHGFHYCSGRTRGIAVRMEEISRCAKRI